MAGMPYSAHAPTNSSGMEAPSRKLKAERACSSTYISRRFPAQTSSDRWSRNKNDRDLAAAKKPGFGPAGWQKSGSEFRDPIHPDARCLRATNRRKFARDRKRPPLRHACNETKRAQGCLLVTAHLRVMAAGTFESRWWAPFHQAVSFPSVHFPSCGGECSIPHAKARTGPFESHRDDAYPPIGGRRTSM